MEQIHLHQLFQEISAKLVCPHCKSRIPAFMLELKESINNSCRFEALCDHCGNILSISAMVEAQITSEGKKMNASSRIHKTPTATPIDESEVFAIQQALQKIPLKVLLHDQQ